MEKERRMLFRGWSRLCIHVASLNAVQEASAAAAAAKTLEKDAAATIPTVKALKKEVAEEQVTQTRRRAKQAVRRRNHGKCPRMTL